VKSRAVEFQTKRKAIRARNGPEREMDELFSAQRDEETALLAPLSGLVGAFDAARVANTGLTSWALTNALSSFQLSGSDTAAMGGDLAYRYGKNGTLAGVGVTPALATLSDANLGTSAQALTPLSGLQTGTVRLS
jgi:hypothetical protein